MGYTLMDIEMNKWYRYDKLDVFFTPERRDGDILFGKILFGDKLRTWIVWVHAGNDILSPATGNEPELVALRGVEKV